MREKPQFVIRGMDFRVRPSSWPIFLAFGAFPRFEVLRDWRLVTWSDDGRTLTFGGIHPDFMTIRSSFTTFFVAVDIAPTIVGIVDAAKYTDVALVDDSGAVVDLLMFTAVTRDLVRRRALHGAGAAF